MDEESPAQVRGYRVGYSDGYEEGAQLSLGAVIVLLICGGLSGAALTALLMLLLR